MKAVVAAFNQEKALVGVFSVITNLRMELFEALQTNLVELIFIHHKTQHGKCVWFRYCIHTPQLFLLLQATSADLRLKISCNFTHTQHKVYWDTDKMVSVVQICVCSMECDITLVVVEGWPPIREQVWVFPAVVLSTPLSLPHTSPTLLVSGTCKQSVAVTFAFLFWGQYGKIEIVIQLFFTKLYGS